MLRLALEEIETGQREAQEMGSVLDYVILSDQVQPSSPHSFTSHLWRYFEISPASHAISVDAMKATSTMSCLLFTASDQVPILLQLPHHLPRSLSPDTAVQPLRAWLGRRGTAISTRFCRDGDRPCIENLHLTLHVSPPLLPRIAPLHILYST